MNLYEFYIEWSGVNNALRSRLVNWQKRFRRKDLESASWHRYKKLNLRTKGTGTLAFARGTARANHWCKLD